MMERLRAKSKPGLSNKASCQLCVRLYGQTMRCSAYYCCRFVGILGMGKWWNYEVPGRITLGLVKMGIQEELR